MVYKIWQKQFSALCIFVPVVKQSLPIVFWDNKENEWWKLRNDEWMVEIDEGHGLAWPWSYWSI